MTALSPAAQAVKDAALAMYADCNVRKLAWPLDMPVVAAALRAAADQVVPETNEPRSQLEYDLGKWDALDDVREQILTIAAELEAQP